jgi:chemotaxis protein MotB
MARKKKDSDVGEGANWMDTYGDLVTLLLTFFVLLFSFSTIDASKWEGLVGAFTGMGTSIISTLDIQEVVEAPIQLEINTALTRNPDFPPPNESNTQNEVLAFQQVASELMEFIDSSEIGAELIPDEQRLTLTLRFTDGILFDSGSATLKPETYEFLEELAQLFSRIMDIIGTIVIEGHTDTDAIHTAEFQDNLALSGDRAENTLRYIKENTPEPIADEKWQSSGFGEWRPIALNDTTEGKAANRRVDFVIRTITEEEMTPEQVIGLE